VACWLLLLAIVTVEVVLTWRCQLRQQIAAPVAQPAERKAATADIRDYARPEDDTFLGYPEWYIVWSYQEKADLQEKLLPSAFPYFGALGQYWSSHCCVARLTRGRYPFNAGEQVMLVIIGSSFSMEYTLKGLYENTVGRLSEFTSSHQPVEEDRYAYKVARDYADFVHIRPFYEFQFARHVRGLWNATSLWGPHPLRKWERKAFLTLDYTVEAFYCWLIEKGTHATYGYEPSDTYAWIDNAGPAIWQELPRVKNIRQVGPKAFIVDIPRYQEFTSIASDLARRGVSFVEIAGNSRILVSAIVPETRQYRLPEGQELFSTPMLTTPGQRRVVIICEVGSLHTVLNRMREDGINAEHVYDY
jgi:hypothetical protein